jgi:hypothetical protein
MYFVDYTGEAHAVASIRVLASQLGGHSFVSVSALCDRTSSHTVQEGYPDGLPLGAGVTGSITIQAYFPSEASSVCPRCRAAEESLRVAYLECGRDTASLMQALLAAIARARC